MTRRVRLITRAALVRLLILVALLVVAAVFAWWWMIRMPGPRHEGGLAELDGRGLALHEELSRDVHELAVNIGQRNRMALRAYESAAQHIERELRRAGLESTRLPSPPDSPHATPGNIVAEIPGGALAPEIIVVGAHYDSVFDCPGANDNASGTAALLALARRLAGNTYPRTLRLVFFVDEEPPYFRTEQMGSLVYARACRAAGDDIVGMLSLETIGCYRDTPGTQQYPRPFSALYPDTGNFIGFVGNVRSRALLHDVIRGFRESTAFPSEGAALPGWIEGVGWSDHWSFWQAGYPGLMITDTALYRYPHYHRPTDTPDKVDFGRMARVVEGVERVVRRLVAP